MTDYYTRRQARRDAMRPLVAYCWLGVALAVVAGLLGQLAGVL